VTGYGGTTQRAEAGATQILDREITIRFDSNVSSELGWDFKPVEQMIRLKIGESRLAFFQAANRTSAPLTGTSTFNVTPEIAGSYFNKLECFCFTEQTLQAGQAVDMPVEFFIDPAIADDPDARNIQEITLSYTFFKVKKPDNAARVTGGAASRTFENAGPPG
jgi:cytochrome c oxidase assembly protein subunit 11